MIEALITVGCIIGYGIGAGLTWEFTDGDEDGPEKVLSAIGWPLALPGIVTARLTRRIRAGLGERRKRLALPEAKVVSK